MRSRSLSIFISGGSAIDTPFSWVVTFAAFICYGISVGCYLTTGVFYTVFLEEFQAKRGLTAIVSALESFASFGGAIFAGQLINHFGCRPVVIVGAVCLGLSFIMTSFSTSIEIIYLTQGLLKGWAIILTVQPLCVVISDHHFQRRPLAMAIVSSGGGVGAAVFANLTEWLITSVGWRWACRVLGFIIFCLGVSTALAFIPIDWDCSGVVKRSLPMKNRELFTIKAFRYLCLSNFFYGSYLPVCSTFLIDFARNNNLSSAKAARLWIFWGISTAAGRLYGGLRSSTPLIRLLWFTLSSFGLGAFSWILAFNFEGYPNYIAFVIYQITSGWFLGIHSNLSSLCMGDAFGEENVPIGMGWFYTVMMPTAVMGPPVLGLVADLAGGNYTQSFQISATMQTVSGLLALLFWKHGRLLIKNREEMLYNKREYDRTCSFEINELESSESLLDTSTSYLDSSYTQET